MEVPNGVYMDSTYHLFYKEGASQYDRLPEELKDVAHEFWGTFPPQHPLIPDIFAIFLFFSWIINFAGNFCVLFIFLTTKELRTATNIFTLNLALSDMLMGLTHNPLVAVNIFMSDYFMWGPLGCKLYASLGGVFGTVSIWTMVIVGFDRYNLIVKGMAGFRISACKAFMAVVVMWAYGVLISMPPFIGWGGYGLEGLLVTCSYDYLSDDWNHKSYILYTFVFQYIFPMIFVVYFYSQIVKAVWAHEAALRAQAKKMNVDSLRSNVDANGESAEVRIAKVAVTNVTIWALAWTPYATVVMLAAFGDRSLITPLVSQLPAFFAKFGSCFNPIIFALSHPKYRQALQEKIPCLGIQEAYTESKTKESESTTAATNAA